MISEHNIKSLNDVELDYKINKYPVPKNEYLPKLYFVSLFIGSRGSGKTYSAVQMLKKYEDSFDKECQRIILFSPTISANPIYTSLKYLDESDIHTNYSDDLLVKVIDDIKAENENTENYIKEMKIYKRFLGNKELNHEEIHDLEVKNYEPPKTPRFPRKVINYLILDDLVGGETFKSVGKSALNNIVIKNRHLSINILILTQSLKSIPKIIRTNTSVFFIFKFNSKKILEDLYEELGADLKEDKFLELYNYATAGDHDSFVVDYTNKKAYKYRKNLSNILQIK
jgi:hypothetical protein